ncbi:MAG TPA: PipX family protein [Synechococcales cyanobacterium M55_K2018_004]|nr:PipX family protein [Synechococcales cyanobacterium M55_K2018_004]
MSHETYLNHPTFGLLYRVCLIEEHKELFATLYAQRLFFVVLTTAQGVQFDPVSRTDARILLEHRLRGLRRSGQANEYHRLQDVYKQTFQ